MSDAYGLGMAIGRIVRQAFNKKLNVDDSRNYSAFEHYFVKQSQSNFAGPMCGIGSYIPSRGGAIEIARNAKRKEPNTLVQVFDANGALVYTE